MTWTIPTPEEQVKFLRNIQRLLAEGLFVASYKFALLHALADLAVLKGDDTGGVVNPDTSYCQVGCDGSPVPKPCYAAPRAML